MAGLAATLNVPDAIEALASALGTRGADGALNRLTGARGAKLCLAVRAVMPSLARVVSDGAVATSVAAMAVDGVASFTALDAGYAANGPAGLLGGGQPYAAIVADGERETLVLARHGNGPGLYYAWAGDGWLAASEPTALLAAGVPARPNVAAIRRFIADAICDDTADTFFDAIHRVRPDEVVVLNARGETRTVRAPEPSFMDDPNLGRVGVLLTPGLPGAAVLGATLARASRPRPLPVHTVAFPGLDGPASHTPHILVPLPHGAVRHVDHQLDAAGLDVDGFLRDVGEPVSDLGLLLAWTVAHSLDAGIDTLLDGSRGDQTCVPRVGDRLAARYGVALRCPLREADAEGIVGDAELMTLATRGLTPIIVRYAVQESAEPVTAGEFVLSRRDAVAAAVATPRPWVDRAGAVDALRRLSAGEDIGADRLLRIYLVERWLAVFDVAIPTAAPGVAGTGPADLVSTPDDVVAGGSSWSRLPVRTQEFVAGDPVATMSAWYAATRIADLDSDRGYRAALASPWFAVVAAKAVSVGQHRAVGVWEIKPGPLARGLSRLATGRARGRVARIMEPWTMQVALDDAGLIRVTAAVVASALGLHDWADRKLPESAAALCAPRTGAVAPADAAVVRAPFHGDEVAATLGDALRHSLAPEVAATLAGCAVVAADDDGARLLGFAAGPYVDAVPDAEGVVAALCADNPSGQGSERTPVLLLVRTPPPRPRTAPDALDRKPNQRSPQAPAVITFGVTRP